MSNKAKRKAEAEQYNALEDKLNALFEQAEADGVSDEREAQTERVLIERMKQTYQNTLLQARLEMRVAKRLKDEQMQTQVRA